MAWRIGRGGFRPVIARHDNVLTNG